MKFISFFLFTLIVACRKEILTDADLKLNEVAAISSSLIGKDKWKSSLYWYCYPASLLKISTMYPEHKIKNYPQIEINYHHFKITISIYKDADDDFKATLKKWKEIIQSEQQVCLYLVQLPDPISNKNGEVFFYIERMKNSHLSWMLKEKLAQ